MASRKSTKPAPPPGIAMTKQRSYASEVKASLGLVLIDVDMVPIKGTDSSLKFRTICPHDEHRDKKQVITEAVALSQQYVDPDHTPEVLLRALLNDPTVKASELKAKVQEILDTKVHGPYTVSSAARAKEVDKVLHPVTQDDIDAIKEADTEAGQFALRSSPAGTVNGHLVPNGTVYRLRPRQNAWMPYMLLMDALEAVNGKYVLYGELNVRDQQKLFLLSVLADSAGNRQIIASEALRPDEIAPFDQVNVPYDSKLLAAAVKVIEDNAEAFDPETYKSRVKARAAELADQLREAGGGTAVSTAAARVASDSNSADSLLAALEASLKAAAKAS